MTPTLQKFSVLYFSTQMVSYLRPLSWEPSYKRWATTSPSKFSRLNKKVFRCKASNEKLHLLFQNKNFVTFSFFVLFGIFEAFSGTENGAATFALPMTSSSIMTKENRAFELTEVLANVNIHLLHSFCVPWACFDLGSTVRPFLSYTSLSRRTWLRTFH